jgi:exopolysaccharide biosynthesis polyprenyl glycosylphosphotransferase
MTETMSVTLTRPAAVAGAEHWAYRYKSVVALVDLVAISITLTAAAVVGTIDGRALPGSVLGLPMNLVVAVSVGIVWMLLLTITASRSSRIVGLGGTEFQRVFVSTFVTLGAAGLTAYFLNLPALRVDLVAAAGIGVLSLTTGRWITRRWLVSKRRVGEMSSRVLLVGSAKSVEETALDLRRSPQAGLHVVGACTPSGRTTDAVSGIGIPIVGDLDRVAHAMSAVGADTVIVTGGNKMSRQAVREISWQLEPGRQHLIVAPSLTDIGGPRLHTRPVAGLPLIHVETPRYDGGKLYVKRAFDILASGALLFVLLPVLLGLAFVVRFTSPGGVIYRQQRVGLRGERFDMLKFRSMYPDAEARLDALLAANEGNGVLFKMKDDPRVTPVGRFIRRYSLDELPQLVNVFLGHMSLVGPRPPLDREVSQYADHVHRRFLVKPGITGLWQVSGRSNLDWDASVRLDLYYVENWTLTGDLVILWKTARSVLASDGAY